VAAVGVVAGDGVVVVVVLGVVASVCEAGVTVPAGGA
jgi:hypothetical protein